MQRKIRENVNIMTSCMTSLSVIFKMALSMEKCQDIIKLYYEHHSIISVTRRMRKMFPADRGVTRLQVSRVVKRFEQHGSVLDQRHSNQGRPRTSRSDENVAEETGDTRNSTKVCKKNSL
jgi:hypothetical protein